MAVRRRRKPEEAEAEIVGAAERFLRSRPLGELSVARLMEQTTLGRSSFYVYFEDIPDVVARLLERVVEALMAPSRPWLEGRGNSHTALHKAIDGVVAVWRTDGPVLRAVAEASLYSGGRVREVYQTVVIEPFVEGVARRIQAEQKANMASPGEPRSLARALILLNERYLVETLGSDPTLDPDPIVDALWTIWSRTLYGSAAS